MVGEQPLGRHLCESLVGRRIVFRIEIVEPCIKAQLGVKAGVRMLGEEGLGRLGGAVFLQPDRTEDAPAPGEHVAAPVMDVVKKGRRPFEHAVLVQNAGTAEIIPLRPRSREGASPEQEDGGEQGHDAFDFHMEPILSSFSIIYKFTQINPKFEVYL